MIAAVSVRLHVVDDLTAIDRHLPPWQDLVDEAEEPNVFLAPWLVLPAARAFGQRLQLLFFYAPHPTHKRQPDILCGVMAMQEHRSRTRLPISTIATFKHRACHLGTPICRPGYTRAVANALLDHVAQGGRRVAMLQEIRGDGPFHEALVDALNTRGFTHVALKRSTRALFRPAADTDSYLEAALEGKRRKELRRQRDRLAEQGVVTVSTLKADEAVEPWLEDFVRLEASGWKSRSEDAMAASPANRAFFMESMTEAHRLGHLDLSRLRCADRTIAMKCDLRAGRGGFAFRITYDEAFAKYSPGVQLELEAIRRWHGDTRLAWVDSCAHYTRFMINHLWLDRRPVEWLAFSTGHLATDLLVSLLPGLGFMRDRLVAPAMARLERLRARPAAKGEPAP